MSIGGEATLLWQAYNGLMKRIKNDMVHHDKPTTLAGLWKLIQAIDSRYWQHKAKVSWETTTSGPSSHKNKNKSSDNSKSDKGKGSSQSKQKNLNQSSGSSQSKGSSLEQKRTTLNLSLKLGKDGKLTQQERQHHLSKTYASSVERLAIWPRTAQNVVQPKLALLNSHKTQP